MRSVLSSAASMPMLAQTYVIERSREVALSVAQQRGGISGLLPMVLVLSWCGCPARFEMG